MEKTRLPTGHIAPFGLRMQPELKERLEAAATAAGRSLNAEIVARLQASFEQEQGHVAGVELTRLMDQVKDYLAFELEDVVRHELKEGFARMEAEKKQE